MINTLIAYDITQLEKKKVLSEALNLYKSKMISEEQWNEIKKAYASKIYTPSIVMKVVLFVFSLIGMTTVIGPIGAVLGDIGRSGYQILSVLLGIVLILFTEKILIKEKFHFSSGITEAGIFSGLSFIAFGIISPDPPDLTICLIIGFILSMVAAVRYLNLFGLVLAVGFFAGILFRLLTAIGGIVEMLTPFIFMITASAIYWSGKKLQSYFPNVIFSNEFLLLKTISLLLFYLAGNYFVVRKLSVALMGLNLQAHDDIPFANLFYILTAFIPAGFLYWGIKHKSILFIRVGLLTIILSALTFKYYFSLGLPVIVITLSGAILILIALIIFSYLKKNRHGFTRDPLLQDKWTTADFGAFIASQTLGGNRANNPTNQDTNLSGGRFGGAGAGGNW